MVRSRYVEGGQAPCPHAGTCSLFRAALDAGTRPGFGRGFQTRRRQCRRLGPVQSNLAFELLSGRFSQFSKVIVFRCMLFRNRVAVIIGAFIFGFSFRVLWTC